jgi:type IV secretory pathway TraG/TraD family ATPase VirD4
MRFIDTPNVRESTSFSDVLLSDITKGNMDLFICIPPQKLETQSRLLKLLTGIVF